MGNTRIVMALVMMVIFFGQICAQVTYDSKNGIFACLSTNGKFCAGDTWMTPLVVKCSGGQAVEIIDCNELLLNNTENRMKSTVCYQTSRGVGNAVCIVNNADFIPDRPPPKRPSVSGNRNETTKSTNKSPSRATDIGVGKTAAMTSLEPRSVSNISIIGEASIVHTTLGMTSMRIGTPNPVGPSAAAAVTTRFLTTYTTAVSMNRSTITKVVFGTRMSGPTASNPVTKMTRTIITKTLPGSTITVISPSTRRSDSVTTCEGLNGQFFLAIFICAAILLY